MSKFQRIYNLLLKFFYCSILIELLFNQKLIPPYKWVFLTIFIFLIINDYSRYYRLLKKETYYAYSIMVSIFLGGMLAIFARGYSSVYFYMLMYEMIVYYNDHWSKRFLIVHILLANISWIQGMTPWRDWKIDLYQILWVFYYFIMVLFFYSIKKQILEKRKIEILNKELEEKNVQLQQYAREIEELTKVYERNRVAGELHDSLGHSLTAMIMHLDFIENIIDQDRIRAKELAKKTQNLARESIENLRETVYALKEKQEDFQLFPALEDLVKSTTIEEGIQIHFDVSKNVEMIDTGIKQILFRTIQEGITNSIKHGHARNIYLQCTVLKQYLHLQLKDDGIGCENIAIGNGLDGVKERITHIGGTVQFSTQKNAGFLVDIKIPLDGGAENDSSGDCR